MEQVHHLGVYGIILDDTGERMVLVKKSRGPYEGLFDLPGGAPEFFEQLEQTLSREVLEETGLKVDEALQCACLLNIVIWDDSHVRHTGIIYECRASGELKTDGDEHDAAGAVWMSVSDIDEKTCTPFVVTAAQVLRDIVSADVS